jgi:hypothetical protein
MLLLWWEFRLWSVHQPQVMVRMVALLLWWEFRCRVASLFSPR